MYWECRHHCAVIAMNFLVRFHCPGLGPGAVRNESVLARQIPQAARNPASRDFILASMKLHQSS